MTLDEFLASVREDIVYPSNGDGTWDGKPCHTCGSQTFLLDPVPVCLVCDANVNNAQAAVERIVLALDLLAELGPKLPEGERAKIRQDIDFVMLGVAKLALAVRP